MLPKSRRGMLERVNLTSSPEPNFLLLNLWTGCYEKIVALVFEKKLKMSGYLYNIIYEKQKILNICSSPDGGSNTGPCDFLLAR